MTCPVAMRIVGMLCTTNATGSAVPLEFRHAVKRDALTCAGTFVFTRGLTWLRDDRVSDDWRTLATSGASCVSSSAAWETPIGCRCRRMSSVSRLPRQPAAQPLPDSKAEQPPVIRRAEIVAFALVALLVICVVAVLYVGQGLLSSRRAAFVVGTMLSPAARFLERHRIPRAVSAVLIVAAVGAVAAFIVGLIASPLMEWSTRLPELGSLLKESCTCSTGRWRSGSSCRACCGGSDGLAALPVPEIRLGPARRRISVADLHRISVVLRDPGPVHRELERPAPRADHDIRAIMPSRLRTLRILNEIEVHLGGYLLTVTLINLGVGAATGLICAPGRNAQSGGARRARRHPEFLPDHRPGRDVRDPDGGRRDRLPHASAPG